MRANFKISATKKSHAAHAIRACRVRNVVATSARRSSAGYEVSVSAGRNTMIDMSKRRYRARTWLRGRLPAALVGLIPKGRHDCGAHEWYRADERTWRCYHCEPGMATSSPWTREEQLQRTLAGINASLRALALAGAPHQDPELAELRRLVKEALVALPEEEHRLERLAAASAADLPALAQALRAA